MDSTTWTVRDFLYQHVECDSATISGMEDRPWSTPDMVIYPNPASNNVTVLVNQTAEELYLEVHDVTGKRIAAYSIGKNTNSLTLPVQNFGKGVFLLSLKDKEGSVLRVKKVVVN